MLPNPEQPQMTHSRANERMLPVSTAPMLLRPLFLPGCAGSQLRQAGRHGGTQTPQLWHVGSAFATCQLSYSMACETLVPQTGVKPLCPAVKGRVLTSGSPGTSLLHSLSKTDQNRSQITQQYMLKSKPGRRTLFLGLRYLAQVYQRTTN